MKRKIAYLVNQYPAPSHTFIRREIIALEKLGWTVHRFTHRESEYPLIDEADLAEVPITSVLLSGGASSILSAIARRTKRNPIKTGRALAFSLRMAWTGERRFIAHLGYFALACVLAERLREFGVSNLHAHFSTNPADVTYLCHVLCGVTYSLTFHGTYEYDDPTRRLNLRDKITHARFLIVISEHGYRTLTTNFPEYSGKIKLIRCGLENNWLCETPSLASNSNQLLCIARLAEPKNPILLIRAVVLMRKRGIEFCLVFAGDGPLRPKIEHMIEKYDLSRHVFIAGWCDQPEIKRHLEQSRAVVLSSHSEGIPIAILEAFALGRPAIATDVGGVSEVVKTGSTGWLVPPDDLQALNKALQECLAAKPEEIEKLADGARMKVRAFSIEKSARALNEAFLQNW